MKLRSLTPARVRVLSPKPLVCDDSACGAERGAFFFFTFPESCVAEELPLSGFQGVPQFKQNYVPPPNII